MQDQGPNQFLKISFCSYQTVDVNVVSEKMDNSTSRLVPIFVNCCGQDWLNCLEFTGWEIEEENHANVSSVQSTED